MANPFDPAGKGNVANLGTLADAAQDAKASPATVAKINAAADAAQSNSSVSVPAKK
jgi:hypothetical protein